MNNNIKVKGKLKSVTRIPLLLTLLFAAITVAIFYFDYNAGLYCAGFVVIYFIVVLLVYNRNNKVMINELIDFATQYGTVQHKLLEEFQIPYAMMDQTGKIMWMNKSFSKVTGREKRFHKSITAIFPQLTKELIEKADGLEINIPMNDRVYKACVHKIFLSEMMNGSDVIETEDKSQHLNVLYLFDETELNLTMAKLNDMRMVSALVYIDDYDSILENVEDVKQSLIIALIDRKVNRYFSNIGGIVKKTEKDKYFVVFQHQYLNKLMEDKFSLIEDVKSIKIANETAITLSIGVGYSADNYQRTYEYSRTAIDLALGRGGDQAVIKTKEKNEYFGGSNRQIDKVTRVKARVKALALREMMMSRDKFLIMGHNLADVDSFGASIGLYCAARQLGKQAQIVVSEITSSLRPVTDGFSAANGYPDDMIISGSRALEVIDSNTVLIVVDTNRPSYTDCPGLITRARTIVVFDHHRQNEERVKNPDLSYIEPYASSTCEMIAEVLQYFDEDIKFSYREADAMYAGILIDTNNFMTKTGVRTFEAAAYLRRNGADVTRVRKMLRNDMAAYKARAAAVNNAEVYREAFAISTCPAENIESPTIACAQAANELLNIIGIKAAVVMTQFHDRIFVSARSIDEINVQRLMEKLGGGGHMNSAGAQLKDVSLEQAKTIIKNQIDELIKEGE